MATMGWQKDEERSGGRRDTGWEKRKRSGLRRLVSIVVAEAAECKHDSEIEQGTRIGSFGGGEVLDGDSFSEEECSQGVCGCK